VNSQLFDHTSLIRFLEARFAADNPDLVETNITPWRRAVVGDLTTAFDFKTPNSGRLPALPTTASFKPQDLERQPDEVPVPPAIGAVPRQESGVRPARALPYALDVNGYLRNDGSFQIDFRNTGDAGAVFQVRSIGGIPAPRTYTVEPGKDLADTWTLSPGSQSHDLSVYGPNGFFRRFKVGLAGPSQVDVKAMADENGSHMMLQLASRGLRTIVASVVDNYRCRTTSVPLNPGETESIASALARTAGWYDFVVTVNGDSDFECQFAGHVENGRDSMSDPALGGLDCRG
jgi:phospholipase C